jgi:hypothetical protein
VLAATSAANLTVSQGTMSYLVIGLFLSIGLGTPALIILWIAGRSSRSRFALVFWAAMAVSLMAAQCVYLYKLIALDREVVSQGKGMTPRSGFEEILAFALFIFAVGLAFYFYHGLRRLHGTTRR